jgi:hypothetical protein
LPCRAFAASRLVSHVSPSCATDASGVGQWVNDACRGNWSSLSRCEPSGFTPFVLIPGVSFQSRLDGVTQGNAVKPGCMEEKSLPDVWGSDARSA